MIPFDRRFWPLNLNQRVAPPNVFNACLERERERWQWINDHGGLKAICPGKRYKEPPWVKMPQQGKRFQKIFDYVVPGGGVFDGLDHEIGSFIVPADHDGAIVTIVFNYANGAGFEEGSGDIVWRLKQNEYYARDLGNVTTQMGSLTLLYQNNGCIRLQSQQKITLITNIATGANIAGGRIIGAVLGWYYPR